MREDLDVVNGVPWQPLHMEEENISMRSEDVDVSLHAEFINCASTHGLRYDPDKFCKTSVESILPSFLGQKVHVTLSEALALVYEHLQIFIATHDEDADSFTGK